MKIAKIEFFKIFYEKKFKSLIVLVFIKRTFLSTEILYI